MKKLSLLFAAILMVFATAQSQSTDSGLVFGKKSSAINLGIGFGNTIYHGAGYKIGFPTISLSYEYGIVEIPMGSSLTGVVSAGGIIGYGGSKYDYSYFGYGYDVKSNFFVVAARANYHFIFHDKLDPYAGIELGYYFGNSKVTYSSNYPSSSPSYSGNDGGFHGGIYAGARWFFSPKFAAFAEVGYGISVFTIGATLKF